VEKFSGLSLKEVKRATMLYLEHNAYDDLRSRDATTSVEQRPSEPEETDPIYRVVAALVVANWETPRNRAPRPQPVEATTKGPLQSTAAEGVIEWSVRRRVATGLQSTSFEPGLSHQTSFRKITSEGRRPGAPERSRVRTNVRVGRPLVDSQSV
jgi:hypothetical protein